MIIPIASDHAGYELKEKIKSFLAEMGYETYDYGPENDQSVDYPDYGAKVAGAVSRGEFERGILLCGSGIGMSIVANKFPGIRATLCHNFITAEYCRRHNDSNILVMGARIIDAETALRITEIWLETPFEAGRHGDRLKKISELEKSICENNR